MLSFGGQRGPGSRRRSRALPDRRALRGRDGPPDAERMRRLEDSLAGKMSEFAGRQGGGADSGNGSSDSEEGEARATDYLDNLLHADAPGEAPASGSGCSSEEFYESVASNFECLIMGWSDVAESICAAKRTENNSDDGGDDSRAGKDKKPVAGPLGRRWSRTTRTRC